MMHPQHHRKRKRSRLLALGPLLLLLSLAPGTLYLDHWSEHFGLTEPHAEGPLEHIGHCHLSPSSCTEQPLPPNPGGLPLIVEYMEPRLTSVPLEEPRTTIEGHATAPLTEPPRA